MTLDNGDIYTGHLDEQGHRHGRGRCEFTSTPPAAAAAATRNNDTTAPLGGGRGGRVYDGEWKNDLPHGYGECVYPTRWSGKAVDSSAEERVNIFSGSSSDDGGDTTAVVRDGQPPVVLLNYKGDWNHGVREGHGACSFVFGVANCSTKHARSGISNGYGDDAITAAATGGGEGTPRTFSACSSSEGSSSRQTVDFPAIDCPISSHVYEGVWVNGRPQGRGILTLRSTLDTTMTADLLDVRTGQRQGSKAAGRERGWGGGGGGGGGGSVIEGLWDDERGLIRGREKVPGSQGGVYEGHYQRGRRDGHGRLELPDGSEYEGERSGLREQMRRGGDRCFLVCYLVPKMRFNFFQVSKVVGSNAILTDDCEELGYWS